MGCDIHFFVERRTPNGWEAVGGEGEYYEGRSYLLFSHLAGVRNGEGVTPITDPRGLPKDMSATVRDYMGEEFCTSWGEIPDYHSHSYLTLAELLAHDWPDGLEGWREDELEHIHQLVKADPSLSLDDVRVVFAFDN